MKKENQKLDWNKALSTISKVGLGFSLLVCGATFMIIASKERGEFGDYPEFLIIGSVIMFCGIVAFSLDTVKELMILKLKSKEKNQIMKYKIALNNNRCQCVINKQHNKGKKENGTN